MTWEEYEWKCDGYVKKQERDWEKYHWIVYNLLQPHVKKGSMPGNFKDYLKRLKPRPALTLKEVKIKKRGSKLIQLKYEYGASYRDHLDELDG